MSAESKPEVIVVTGASAGVGRATAVTFAKRGAHVGLLARTGYDSQQTDEPVDPNLKDNVFSPLGDDKDYGAHGSFDSRAKPRSHQLWATKHRDALAGTVFGRR